MNISQNEALIEKLAAEYVLGTLTGGARRRFEKWLTDSAALRRAVAEWQDRLNPMAEFAGPVAPSPVIWRSISRELGLDRPQSESSSVWNSLNFWRNLGLVSSVMATILLAVLVVRQPEVTPLTSYVATLSDDKSQAVAVVTGDAKRRIITVKLVTGQSLATDKSLELWAVPKTGAPRSLGLLAADGTITLPLPDHATPQTAPLLAVTLEPKGGSPDPNGPTGPVVFKGAWIQV